MQNEVKYLSGPDLLVTTGRELRNCGILVFVSSSVLFYSFNHLLRVEAKRKGIALQEIGYKEFVAGIMVLFLISLIAIIGGEGIKRKKRWAYKLSLYSCWGTLLSSLLIHIPLPGFIFTPFFLIPAVYFLYRLTRPQVTEQFKK
ncbi:MAG: hypothetical protein HY399_05115 [Elusimicrobia bacterium]|nr:hypothetical protein [Elusimicrobiota bacterium]